MSGLLRRWSRLKTASRTAAGESGAVPAREPEVDAADLPSLDSLGRDSDYTLLFRAGIPAAVKLAGLRRAWTSDPAIAEFKGFGEYDWDFNAPGYGAWTGPAEEAVRLAEAVLGPAPSSDPSDTGSAAVGQGDDPAEGPEDAGAA